jgi:AcrR family transcriptional regulator
MERNLKSAQTRARLVDATIRCIVKFGYANTITSKIAAEAGMSRGAMLHHFEFGSALIKATIVELHERRIRAFRRASKTVSHDPATMVREYWRQLQKPAFVAFHELALAARSSKDLARILHPLEIDYRERFMKEAVELFPEWHADRKSLQIAMTLSQTLLEGMAIKVHTGSMDSKMIEPMLRLVERELYVMNPDLKIRHDAEASVRKRARVHGARVYGAAKAKPRT